MELELAWGYNILTSPLSSSTKIPVSVLIENTIFSASVKKDNHATWWRKWTVTTGNSSKQIFQPNPVFPLQNAAGLLQMTMVHVCQQFTVVAPWLGLRPHSRGGCIIVTGFSGCAVKQFHAVNRKCNRLRVSILVSSSGNLGDVNPRTSSWAVVFASTCTFPFDPHLISSLFIWLFWVHMGQQGFLGLLWIILVNLWLPWVVLGYYQW